MRRLSSSLVFSAATVALPGIAAAAPPSLPADEAGAEPEVVDPAAEAPAADAAPVTGDAAAGGTVEGGATLGGDAGGTAPDAGFVTDDSAGIEGPAADDGSDFGLGAAGAGGAGTLDEEGSAEDGEDDTSNDPGMVRGRREATAPISGAGIGLFHTSLPDVGGKHTFRFRLGTDFFKKEGFFCCDGGGSSDTHSRIRGGIDLGFTVAKWGELFFGVHSAANRNEREQAGRQDPPTVFALGDMNFGFKGAWRFKNGVGVGGQLGLGLITGSDRLITERVNFHIDALFALDLRYLTKKHAPVRFGINVGYMLDNSIKVVDWTTIEDDLSREVLRFSMNANHSRVRMRYAVDFPIRFGKERKFGIDPILEYSWDVATHEEPAFRPLTEQFGDAPLQRSQSWLTLGLRANLVDGLFIDAGVDIGTSSPNYEFGPPTPPWQMMMGLGWSIDPHPVFKEVEAEAPAPVPEPVLDGRVIGRVVDAGGAPVVGAQVNFPGYSTNTILTDEAGMFTSYRFPAGMVTVSVTLSDGSTMEQTADVQANLDTEIDIAFAGDAPAADGPVGDGTLYGTLVDASGIPVKEASVHITGNGVDEPFTCCDENGSFGVRLPAGQYTAKITAAGYKDKDISFSVAGPDEDSTFSETLEADKPAETPNVSGNKNRLRLRRAIRYNGDAVSSKSHALLDEVAAFMKGHPEYAKVEIRVHTDDRGNPRKRSTARADSVRAYLVGQGVSGDRLVSNGYGDKKPMAVNLTPEGRAKNNRTELRVKTYTGG
jgi:outer membrane protein OmpA-like peptidoglycan-associated protein